LSRISVAWSRGFRQTAYLPVVAAFWFFLIGYWFIYLKVKEWEQMAGGGLVTSIVVFAVGAILRFAVTVTTYQHGFDIHAVGTILMIVAAVGAVLSVIGMLSAGMGRHRTVIDDGQGNVVKRDDTFIG
jgi:FtsH-binding integral membrane protein